MLPYFIPLRGSHKVNLLAWVSKGTYLILLNRAILS